MKLCVKGYNVVLTSGAKKELYKIVKSESNKILTKLKELVSGDENLNLKKIVGYDNLTYRMRSGNYRVIFEVRHGEIIILVIDIGHRKDIYRRKRM